MQLVPAGDAALLARFGSVFSPSAYRRALALWRALAAERAPGIVDAVLAYASVLVCFDPLLTDAGAVAQAIHSAASAATAATGALRGQPFPGRLVTIPVRYGGAEGPDLAAVAQWADLAPQDVIRRHTRPTYRVYFLGFTAGFPYLGGLPASLAAPRLSVPRTRVPAGSVGIAGQQTGIYPAATPGGWRLIGRTAMPLFDPARNPPALLQPGDRVRFVAVSAQASAAPMPPDTPGQGVDAPPGETTSMPWLRVRHPGALTTVQDHGRSGYASAGVAAAGAVDRDTLALGNLVLGNTPEAAALEITLGAADFEVLTPCVVAVTGASCAVRVARRRVRLNTALSAPAGARIEIGPAEYGARAYLCVAGGVAVPLVLGSRATDLRAAMGGCAGRALRAGDTVHRGPHSLRLAALAGRALPPDAARTRITDGDVSLRVLPGPHAQAHPHDLDALLAGTFTVDARSDRMGARLTPVLAEARAPDGSSPAVGGEVLTEGVPDGAVQLPPSGQPIVLLADHQTTGGYRVPAVVIGADLWRAAQLYPGARVRFVLTTAEDAIAARRERQAWLRQCAAWLAHGAASSGPEQDTLMGGFAEWSEEVASDDT